MFIGGIEVWYSGVTIVEEPRERYSTGKKKKKKK